VANVCSPKFRFVAEPTASHMHNSGNTNNDNNNNNDSNNNNNNTSYGGPSCRAMILMGLSLHEPFSVQGGSAGASEHITKATALEVMESVTPVMAATSGIMSLFFESLIVDFRSSIYFSSLQHVNITIALIGASALLAFFMVWAEYALIAATSALTFMVAGQVKEILTIIFFVVVSGTPFMWVNGFGLAVLMCGLILFNYSKYLKLQQAAEKLPVGQEASGALQDTGGVPRDRVSLLLAAADCSSPAVKGLSEREVLVDGRGHCNGNVMLELSEQRVGKSAESPRGEVSALR
jgi:hypothetical protein